MSPLEAFEVVLAMARRDYNATSSDGPAWQAVKAVRLEALEQVTKHYYLDIREGN